MSACDEGERNVLARFVDWFFRDPFTGRLVIVQAPNLALWIFIGATAVRLLLDPDGAAATITSIVSRAALVWWAVDEIVRGDSRFRRVLGGVVLATTAIALISSSSSNQSVLVSATLPRRST